MPRLFACGCVSARLCSGRVPKTYTPVAPSPRFLATNKNPRHFGGVACMASGRGPTGRTTEPTAVCVSARLCSGRVPKTYTPVAPSPRFLATNKNPRHFGGVACMASGRGPTGRTTEPTAVCVSARLCSGRVPKTYTPVAPSPRFLATNKNPRHFGGVACMDSGRGPTGRTTEPTAACVSARLCSGRVPKTYTPVAPSPRFILIAC